jgi:hypothetical protein
MRKTNVATILSVAVATVTLAVCQANAVPITFASGYIKDMVAGTSGPATSTDPPGFASKVYYSSDACVTCADGFAPSGVVVTPLTTYQLASYGTVVDDVDINSNNGLLLSPGPNNLTGTSDTGTMVLSLPSKFATLYLLDSSFVVAVGGGPGTAQNQWSATLNFLDGNNVASSTTYVFTDPSFTATPVDYAVTVGMATQSAPNYAEAGQTTRNLFEQALVLDVADQSKFLQSITLNEVDFTGTSSGNRVGSQFMFLAASGDAPVELPEPSTLTLVALTGTGLFARMRRLIKK